MRAKLILVSFVLIVAVGAVSKVSAAYVDAVLADNPVAYWGFEDGGAGSTMSDGASAADRTGSHGGTYRNGVPLIAGMMPGTAAADFDGASDYVTTTTLGNFGSTLGTGSTLEFWVKTTEARLTRQPMGVLNQANSIGFVVDFNRDSNLNGSLNRYNFYLRGNSWQAVSTHTLGPDYRDGQWHHMAWVVNDPSTNDVDLYRDGQLISQGQGTAQGPTSFSNFQFPFMIGANNNRGTPGAHTDAAIDEVAIFDHPLTAAQIAAHFNAKRASLPIDDSVLLHLAGDYVTTAAGQVAVWNDLSGNVNHATQNVNTALRPTPISGALNGHQVVRFEHEDIMDMLDLHVGPEATFLMVTQNSEQTAGGSIHRTVLAPRNNNPEPYSAAGNGYALGYFRDGADAFNISLGNGSAEQKVTDSLAADNEFEIVTYRHSGTVGELLRDAVSVASGPHTRTSNFATGYSIGRQAGNAQRGYRGDVAEVIVYDRALTPDEYHQVGFYLDQKYALNTAAYVLRADLDYRNYTPPDQVWQDASLLNNDGVLGQSTADTARDPIPSLKGFLFDATSPGDQITLARSPSLDFGSTADGADFTVEMWVNAASLSGTQALLETRGSDWTGFGLLSTDTNGLRLFMRTSTGFSDTLTGGADTLLSAKNEYQHVAAVFDANDDGTGQLDFYLNGLLAGSDTWTGLGGTVDGDGDFLVGHGRSGTSWLPFDGEIGLVRIHAAALGSDAILASFQQDYAYFVPEPGTIALLALGLGILAVAASRRRRRP